MIARVKYIIFVGLFLLIFSIGVLYHESNVTFIDSPGRLEKNVQAIELYNVYWCWDSVYWYESYKQIINKNLSKKDFIFIEPTNPGLVVPDSFWNRPKRKIKIKGSYYSGMGLPENFVIKASGKPGKGKVFRYTELEIAD